MNKQTSEAGGTGRDSADGGLVTGTRALPAAKLCKGAGRLRGSVKTASRALQTKRPEQTEQTERPAGRRHREDGARGTEHPDEGVLTDAAQPASFIASAEL